MKITAEAQKALIILVSTVIFGNGKENSVDGLLPIEPDCLCMLIAGTHAGNEVTAIKRLPEYPGDHWWEIKAPWLDGLERRNIKGLWRARQCELVRIDGFKRHSAHAKKERPAEHAV